MAQMMNKTHNNCLVKNLFVAQSFRTRLQGLIGRKHLKPDEGMWFPSTQWIHSFFMSMTIDVIYLDKQMKVTKLQAHLKPYRLPLPVWKARSVLEVPKGFIAENLVEMGDQLYVGD